MNAATNGKPATSFGDIPVDDYLAIVGESNLSSARAALEARRDRAAASLITAALRRANAAERSARFWRRTAILFGVCLVAAYVLQRVGGAA